MPNLLPGEPDVTAQAPQNKVGAEAFQRAPEYVQRVGIAPGLEQLGAGLDDLAVPLAKAQAASDVAANHDANVAAVTGQNTSVVKDATGASQVVTPVTSFILGRAGEAYNDAVMSGTAADMQAAIRQKVTELHVQYPTNPDAFMAAAGGAAEALRTQYPGQLGNQLAAQVHNEAVQHWGAIVEGNANRDVAFSLQSINANIDYAKNQATTIARQGGIGTPAYQQHIDELNNAYDQLAANPKFGYSQAKVDEEKAQASAFLNGQFVAGRIDEIYNRKGKAAAFDAVRDQIDNNPELDHLPLAQRNELHNFAMARLDYLSTEAASSLAALKPTVELQVKKLQAGNTGPGKVSDAEYDQTMAQLNSLGAFREAGELGGARIVANRTIAFQNLTPGQKAVTLLNAADAGVGGPIATGVNTEQGALQYFQSQGWSPAQAAGIVGNLIHESGGNRLNPSAINRGDGSDGSDSLGIGQWNGDRAAALQAFAATQGKPVTDLRTQLAFVQHELMTSESAAAAKLKGAQTPQDAAAAFALGYERPAGFQTGDLSKVAGGQNRLDQTMRLASGGASSTAIPGSATPGITTFGQPFTDAEAAVNPWLRTAYRQQIVVDDKTQAAFAKSQAATIEKSISLTGAPSPDMIPAAATVLQIAARNPDDRELTEATTKMRGALAGGPAGFAAAGTPDHGASVLSQAEDYARTGDPFGNAIYEHVKEGVKLGDELMKSDKFEYARQAQWFPGKPADLGAAIASNDPNALLQSVNQHAVMATKIASKQGLSADSIFAQNEMPVVKDVVQNGTIDQRLGLLTAISHAPMSQPMLKATLGALGSDAATAPFAVAGDVARSDPVAARGILQGQALAKVDPRLAPNKDDFPTEFAKAIPFNDLPMTGARSAIDGAVQAYYAKLSADANDTTGVINDDRMAKSIEAVTGGVRSYRGSSFIAPWYGATQSQTDAAIRSLSDADFAGARTTNGDSFPAAALKPSLMGALTWNNWRLQSAGDGKYLVFSGPDDKRQYLGNAQGGKFVLDLGSKREVAERADAGPLFLDGNRGNLYNSALIGGGN